MRINSDIVGARLKEYTTCVEWRQTTNYAASVGDMNPRYFDDLREGGLSPRPCMPWRYPGRYSRTYSNT